MAAAHTSSGNGNVLSREQESGQGQKTEWTDHDLSWVLEDHPGSLVLLHRLPHPRSTDCAAHAPPMPQGNQTKADIGALWRALAPLWSLVTGRGPDLRSVFVKLQNASTSLALCSKFLSWLEVDSEVWWRWLGDSRRQLHNFCRRENSWHSLFLCLQCSLPSCCLESVLNCHLADSEKEGRKVVPVDANGSWTAEAGLTLTAGS